MTTAGERSWRLVMEDVVRESEGREDEERDGNLGQLHPRQQEYKEKKRPTSPQTTGIQREEEAIIKKGLI